MKIIVGLGNPGREYEKTRHNFGFKILDELAAAWGVSFKAARFKAETASAEREGQKVLLVKPQTFMNLSGEAVSAALHFYREEIGNLLVVYDELDFPLGKVRWARNGSAAGHNGMRSVIAHLKSPEFHRLRLGIGRPLTPAPIVDYVLSPFSREEQKRAEEIAKQTVQAVDYYLAHGIERTMNRFN